MSNYDDQLYRNLIAILKLFKNRPYHLAKYLIENDALDKRFIEKLLESHKLNQLGDLESPGLTKAVYFVNISHMNDFFNSLTNNANFDSNKKDNAEDLNRKLDECIRLENYEDAIRIRDYMNKHNIKRKSDEE